jgi:hypothetical protein
MSRNSTPTLKLLQHPIPQALWTDLRAEKVLHPDAPTPG